MMNLRLNDPARRAELRELLLDAQREGTGYGNTAERWRALFGDPMPGEDEVIIALLDEIDRRPEPLTWRRMAGDDVERLPFQDWQWVKFPGLRPDIMPAGKVWWEMNDGEEVEIAGPIPEPMEGERG